MATCCIPLLSLATIRTATRASPFDGTTFYVDNVNNGNVDEFDINSNYVKTLHLTRQTYFLGEDLSVNAAVLPPSTPEPASILLLGSGLIGMGLLRHRRRAA